MENTHKFLPFRMMMVVIVVVIVVQNVGVLMVDGSWDQVQSLPVYGEDESTKKEASVLEKFGTLLGLKSCLHNKIKPYNGAWENGSPAPSPSPASYEAKAPARARAPAPAPAPAPARAAHIQSLHQPGRPRPMLPIHKFNDQQKKNGKKKVVITAILVSTGVVLLICALCIFRVFRKVYKHQKRATRTASLSGNHEGHRDKSRSVSSQNLARKVSHDPGFDLFDHNTLTTASEPLACMEGTSDNLNT